jgi:hypothetical protein
MIGVLAWLVIWIAWNAFVIWKSVKTDPRKPEFNSMADIDRYYNRRKKITFILLFGGYAVWMTILFTVFA